MTTFIHPNEEHPAEFYKQGWLELTRKLREAQHRHLDRHEGDVYHLCQSLTVQYGLDERGPMIERLTKIDRFDGPWRFLSNFHPSKVVYGGFCFPTVEHAYQAAKTHDIEEAKIIALAVSPGMAKRLGRKVTLREDWESAKEKIMASLLALKFQIPELKTKLLATGDLPLEEGNDWGDRYWGTCKGTGKNRLGILLMELRAQLRTTETLGD